MANLQYKTRGMSNPKGKPKVYFCCHEADFEKYFESISEELLGLQNCSVWYAAADALRDEELLADLGEMQLFVMPVTTKLLTTENAALDVEFRFAVEHHIPVLPLMQESGLDELFSVKCGDLQYLDKYVRDMTAIPYEEKLKKYLESVLVSDEMAEKIRAAFDAYVFLSYRKKDRKYAQELMRLIHKNDFCRDIAIWYDEFLTPGENFNESIREALQKSGLFVMAVTPNLVNEENYIVSIEYPMAKEAGKLILPAELVPTDQTKLAENFAGIPTCADAYNDAVFSAMLLENVKKLAIRENDSSPEHNFFIGLAYLNGIDVEVDHERAVKLITGAAEAGLVEAAGQLAEMYHAGLGVSRNYATFIEWKEKKVDLLEKKWRETTDREILQLLLDEGVECAIYCSRQRPLKAKGHYEKVRKWVEISGDASLRPILVTAANGMGDVSYTENDYSGAREHYQEAYELAERFAVEMNTPEACRCLAVSCSNLGKLYCAEGDFAAARKHYEKSLALFEATAAETGTAESRREWALDLELFGFMCRMGGDSAGAQRCFERAVEIRKQLWQETGTDRDYRNLRYSETLSPSDPQWLQDLEKRTVPACEEGAASHPEDKLLSVEDEILRAINEALGI